MRIVFEEILRALREPSGAALATVVTTEGTAPRKEGAKMLVTGGGTLKGAVSMGGCVDAQVAVEEIRFSGEMCAIAKAAASMLFAALEGMTPAAIIDWSDEQVLGSVGGPIKSNRVKCALLPVIAFRGAIQRGDGHAMPS